MQLLEHWDPLSLPRGSIRALVSLGLLGVLWAHMILGNEISFIYACAVLLVLGHYFGFRSQPLEARKEKAKEGKQGEEAPARKKMPAPLWLPRGSVRAIMIIGFAAVGYYLYQADRLHLPMDEGIKDNNLAVLTLCASLIAGFLLRNLLDLVSRGETSAARRFFENLKAVVGVVAAGVLALFTFLGPGEPSNQQIALVAAPLVAFYLGSRR